MGNKRILIYAFGKRTEKWAGNCRYDTSKVGEVKRALLEEYVDWAGELQDFIRSAEEVTLSQIYMLPIGHGWTSRKGFTLIGDAAHFMTPFAGEGLNVAMLDALELAQEIIASTQNGGASCLATAVVFERAGAVAEVSRRSKEFMFRGDAPGGLIKELW
ncbi:MAG: hypothetical protein FRX48_00459 [Lasallia pustulata]|uniref:FAD-binding domain-containing protein n=1 Tax=Lasallia pustulata TaxID=136370 RepID=A0A5M8Q404_9LECA|nr:MAG: hypothetical protein FRX48_00459 [Lasallia pustulata]